MKNIRVIMMKFHLYAALVLMLTSPGFASNRGVPYLNNPDYERTLYVRVGESKRIQCPVSTDEGTIIFSWYKDNEEVNEGWERYTLRRSDEGKTLKIDGVLETDEGEFKCDATSGYGKIEEPVVFQLIVLDDNEPLPYPDTNDRPREQRPEFQRTPPGDSAISLMEGATARLSCLPKRGTTPRITWYYNGAKIATQEGYTLNLTDVRKLETEGDYQCELSNTGGQIEFTYNIRIQEQTKTPAEVLPAFPPITVVNFGMTASLQCRVKSSIPPKIEWLKLADASLHQTNAESIKVKGKIYIKVSNKTTGVLTDGYYLNKLVIPGARLEDSGLYICRGTNQLGGSNISEARLTVKPVATDIPTEIASESEFSNWEYIFGSPSATLAVIIAIPVIFILLLTIGIIYCLNKRKRMASRRRQPINSVVKSDREASVPLNVNGNNGCYTGQYSTYSRPADQYSSGGENGYEPVTYPKKQQHPYYTTYSQSDGSYRSQLHYTPTRQYVPPQNDIPDDDSHFSSVSHSRPQYMSCTPGGYTRDVHSDPTNRMSIQCPPPPPGSYCGGQW